MKKKYLIIGISIFLGIFFWLIYCFVPVLNCIEKRCMGSLEIGEIKIYDKDNFLITHLPKKDGFFLEISADEKIPEKFEKFLLLKEDKRFRTHWGVDFLAKMRAIQNNIFSGKIISGGSTLTEQWIKNEYFRGEKRTFLQKFRESTLALYFSGKFSKDEILKKYLNSLYFGNQIYGLQSASLVYFQKSNLESLTDSEISILLDILQVPSRAKNKYKFSGLSKKNAKNLFPHVTEKTITRNTVHRVSTDIYHTQIDTDLQKKTRDFMQNQLEALRDKNVSNAAVLAFSPKTGKIFLEQGSRDFFSDEIDGQVNVVYQKRQMGSALKPFLYFMAFENGSTPENFILDMEQSFYQEGQGAENSDVYHPLNYNLQESGIVPLKYALSNSLNISAVKILQKISPKKFLEFLQKQGLKFDFPASHYGLSLALGSPDLTMWEVAHGYVNMMNREKTKKFSESQQLLWKTLSSQENRAGSFGLNSVLNTTVPMMVKTGTTHNFKDNWVFAYHPDVMIAVWVGNNDSSPMKGVSGVSGAGPIFHFVAEEMKKKGYFSSEISEYFLEKKDQKKLLSQPEKNIYCREDFYIPEISDTDIEKVQKIWGKDVEIKWCEEGIENISQSLREDEVAKVLSERCNSAGEVRDCHGRRLPRNDEKKEKTLQKILSPENSEVFYINSETPRELQKIIFKRDESAFVSTGKNSENFWILNDTKISQANPFFWTPKVGKFHLTNGTDEVFFEVKDF